MAATDYAIAAAILALCCWLLKQFVAERRRKAARVRQLENALYLDWRRKYDCVITPEDAQTFKGRWD